MQIEQKTITQTFEKHQVAEIRLCDDPIYPRNNSNLGYMLCWHKKYNLGDTYESNLIDRTSIHSWAGVERAIRDVYPDIIYIEVLSLYDHTAQTMTLGYHSGYDCGQIGFYIVTRKQACEWFNIPEYDSKYNTQLELRIKGEIQEYNKWLHGTIYEICHSTKWVSQEHPEQVILDVDETYEYGYINQIEFSHEFTLLEHLENDYGGTATKIKPIYADTNKVHKYQILLLSNENPNKGIIVDVIISTDVVLFDPELGFYAEPNATGYCDRFEINVHA